VRAGIHRLIFRFKKKKPTCILFSCYYTFLYLVDIKGVFSISNRRKTIHFQLEIGEVVQSL